MDKNKFPLKKGDIVQIYSALLEESFKIDFEGDIFFLDDEGFKTVFYKRYEWKMLGKSSKEMIKKIHSIKKLYKGSTVDEIINKGDHLEKGKKPSDTDNVKGVQKNNPEYDAKRQQLPIR